MKTTGTGSRLSPIAIDDSEDEVLQELVGEACFESISAPFTTDQRDKAPRNGTSNGTSIKNHQNPSFEGDKLVFLVLGARQTDQFVTGRPPQKRKRATNEVQ
ncbi:hypothetical protein C0991_000321, partial [Blastosporella zonata]